MKGNKRYIKRFLSADDLHMFQLRWKPSNREHRKAFEREIAPIEDALIEIVLAFEMMLFMEGMATYDALYQVYNEKYQKKLKELMITHKPKYTVWDSHYFLTHYSPKSKWWDHMEGMAPLEMKNYALL